MPTSPKEDIINGATPLETRLWGVHPRLYFTAARLAALKQLVGREPWKGFLATVRRSADRGHLPHQALVFLLTGEQRYRDLALAAVDKLTAQPGGRSSLVELALVYDWLYPELDEARRAALRAVLDRDGRALYEKLAKCETYAAIALVWNIGLAEFLACATAGCALYGDVPKVAPWLRYVQEHARSITAALGPDGVSPEGISYGGVSNEFYVRAIDLVRDLLGDDLYAGNDYLRNLPYFYLYSMLPRRRLGFQHAHVCYGDAVRYSWCGPDNYLRRAAGIYRDPHAQWAAAVLEKAGACCESASGAFLNLAWFDPSVRPRPPRRLPRLRHFQDNGLVILRSGWQGNAEAVLAFRCGPHAGHHALRHYTQSIGGGHMCPDAGSFVLFARGDWLVCDGGYARKFTAYHNTVLVNGIGQTGEKSGDWFECVELRREKRGPRMLRAEERAGRAVITGDATAAYEHRAGLRRFWRHVVCPRPDTWVLVDELRAEQPATFELYFHSHGAAVHSGHFKPDQPFVADGPRAWTTGGQSGRLRLTSLTPEGVAGAAEIQKIENVASGGTREMDILRLRNLRPLRQAVFVTVLEAFPARRPVRSRLTLRRSGPRGMLAIADQTRRWRVVVRPFLDDAARSISIQGPGAVRG